MDIDYREWINKFEEEWAEKPIRYKSKSEQWKEDPDPLFGSISAAIQSRGRITVDELLEISRWKMEGGRNDENIEENDPEKVIELSERAFNAESDKEAVTTLKEISGVGIPLASTILTVAYPYEYAIIDYRGFRGLLAAKPEIRKKQEYEHFSKFMEYFRTYLKNPDAYVYYMNIIREIANDEGGLSAREVDMALWALDKEIS